MDDSVGCTLNPTHISMPSLLSGTFRLRLPPTGPTTHASRRPRQCAIPPGGSNSTRALRRPRLSSSHFYNPRGPSCSRGLAILMLVHCRCRVSRLCLLPISIPTTRSPPFLSVSQISISTDSPCALEAEHPSRVSERGVHQFCGPTTALSTFCL